MDLSAPIFVEKANASLNMTAVENAQSKLFVREIERAPRLHLHGCSNEEE